MYLYKSLSCKTAAYLISILLLSSSVLAQTPAEVSALKNAPGGVLELRHEAGYIAKFVVVWDELMDVGEGVKVPIPKIWESGDVALGWSHRIYIPASAKNIRVTAEGYVFIGTRKPIFSRLYEKPTSACFKVFGTIAALSHAECEPGDFSEGLKAASDVIEKYAKVIEIVTRHLGQNADKLPNTAKLIRDGNNRKALEELNIGKLLGELRQTGLVATAAPYGINQNTNDDGYVEIPADTNGTKQQLTFADLTAAFSSISLSASVGASYGTGGTFFGGFAIATREWYESYVGDVETVIRKERSDSLGTVFHGINWEVCCGIGPELSASISLNTGYPDTLSGVAYGYSVGGVHAGITIWFEYGDGIQGNFIPGEAKLLAIEIAAGGEDLSVGYYRSWTCASASDKPCKNILGQ